MRRSATQAIKEFEASPGPKTMGSASASGAAHPTSIIGLLQSKAPGAQIPYNPFMTTGALSLTAILSKLFRHGDSGSRFDSILSLMRRLAGGGKVGFNNPVFLNLKQDGLNAMALSHYMKGMQCYPQGTDPTDVANFYFQCMSLEMNARQLSVVAASLAAMGRCPLTGEQVLRPGILKPLLSVMYSCGLNQYSGKWQFHVGIPATASGSGTLMLIIPNVMGMVIYAPDMRGGDTVVSRRAEKLCELLVSRFRVNLFDHLVYGNEDIQVFPSERRTETVEVNQSHLFNDLCTAAGAGDVHKVIDLIEGGAPLLYVDYDYRSALHIAACEGHLQVVRVLVEAGHPLNVRDRWNHTPLHEAVTCVAPTGPEVYKYLRRVVWLSGQPVPPTEQLLEEASEHKATNLAERAAALDALVEEEEASGVVGPHAGGGSGGK
jgi:glutaminase